MELFFGFIILIVGLVLVPTINGYTSAAADNSTGLAAVLLPFVPAIFAVVIIVLAAIIIKDATKKS
jgi:hypothetical protein